MQHELHLYWHSRSDMNCNTSVDLFCRDMYFIATHGSMVNINDARSFMREFQHVMLHTFTPGFVSVTNCSIPCRQSDWLLSMICRVSHRCRTSSGSSRHRTSRIQCSACSSSAASRPDSSGIPGSCSVRLAASRWTSRQRLKVSMHRVNVVLKHN